MPVPFGSQIKIEKEYQEYRTLIQGDKIFETPYLQIGYLVMDFNGNKNYGTAFVIKGKYALTCGHNFYDYSSQ